jgi:hypothetical protein
MKTPLPGSPVASLSMPRVCEASLATLTALAGVNLLRLWTTELLRPILDRSSPKPPTTTSATSAERAEAAGYEYEIG